MKTKKVLGNLAWIIGSPLLTVLVFYWIWSLPANTEILEGLEGEKNIVLIIFSFFSILWANFVAWAENRAIGKVNAWIAVHLAVIIYLLCVHVGLSPWHVIAFCSVSVMPTFYRKGKVECSKAKLMLYGHYFGYVLTVSYLIAVVAYFLMCMSLGKRYALEVAKEKAKTDFVAYPRTVVRDLRRTFPRDFISTDAHGIVPINWSRREEVDIQKGDTVQLLLDDGAVIGVLSNSRTDKK